jgi:hypothetical protein
VFTGACPDGGALGVAAGADLMLLTMAASTAALRAALLMNLKMRKAAVPTTPVVTAAVMTSPE